MQALLPHAREIADELLRLLAAGACQGPRACPLAPLIVTAMPEIEPGLTQLFREKAYVVAPLLAHDDMGDFRRFWPLLQIQLDGAMSVEDRLPYLGALTAAGAIDDGEQRLASLVETGREAVRLEAIAWLGFARPGNWTRTVLRHLESVASEQGQYTVLLSLERSGLPSRADTAALRKLALTDARLPLGELAMAILAAHSPAERSWLLRHAMGREPNAWRAVQVLRRLDAPIVAAVCEEALSASNAEATVAAARILARADGSVSFDLFERLLGRARESRVAQVAFAKSLPSVLPRLDLAIPSGRAAAMFNAIPEVPPRHLALAIDSLPAGTEVDAALMGLIESWATSPSHRVRRATAHGMGRLVFRQERAGRLPVLLARLAADRDLAVRIAAVGASGARSPGGPLDAVAEAVLSEGLRHGRTDIRAAALGALTHYGRRGERMLAVLQSEPPGTTLWTEAVAARLAITGDGRRAASTLVAFLVRNQASAEIVAGSLPCVIRLLPRTGRSAQVYAPVIRALRDSSRTAELYDLYGSLLEMLASGK